MEVELQIECWPLVEPFHIAGKSYLEIECVVAIVRDGEHFGRGEAAGVDYLGETATSIVSAIEAAKPSLGCRADRVMLRSLLPAGGARNALDCAMWELEASISGVPAWQRAGVASPTPRLTTCTIGAGSPQHVAGQAAAYRQARALKVKLLGDALDADRVRAVRAARPDVWLSVDGNCGFSRESLQHVIPTLVECRVSLIEQPMPVERDAELISIDSPIPFGADESVQDLASLRTLTDAYSVVNLKLDKCGGLTEALEMVDVARARGKKIMVGNMIGTSLAMAPAYIVSQFCDIVDLDGPIFLQADRDAPVVYRDGMVWCPGDVWGGGSIRTAATVS
ncbi:MAG: dipeptide epimerase [Sphingomonadales bacterium]|nr:MAG: dipeptide epimerase [Sphingomonadales bacterium]